MIDPIKTPTEMLMEQAHIPHYGVGGTVMKQFASRIQEAIRRYVKATGKMPTKEEVAQLEQHIQSLAAPAPKTGPAPTQARLRAETPAADKLVDANGRPYATVPHPKTGAPMTPERTRGYSVKDEFGMGPGNMAARKDLYDPAHVNVFGEDPFLSMANTGRLPSRTWMKSYTPSVEEIAQRELAAEAPEATGGLGRVMATEGDVPMPQKSQIAETATDLEMPLRNKIADEMAWGMHRALARKVEQDFKARGIVPDEEDILNGVVAEINPLRHNYTGVNPIGERPQPPRGRPTAAAEAEMNAWRDKARASGLPDTVVSEHPIQWPEKSRQDYLLDVPPEQRAPFSKEWKMKEHATGGLISGSDPLSYANGGMPPPPSTNPNPAPVTGAAPQMTQTPQPYNWGSATDSPASQFHSADDMRAEMLVRGYADGKIVKKYRPTAGDFGRSALQGLSLGWGDEGEAAIRAALGKESYAQNLARIQAEQKQFEEAMPGTDTALKIVGGIPHLAVPALRAASIPAMLAQGAVWGAGSAEPGQRLEGAAWGAPMSVAGGKAIEYMGKGANAAYQAARKRMMNPEARIAQEFTPGPFDYRAGMKAESSPARQEWIGRVHEAGAKAFDQNDPAYKAAVYASWLKNRPEIIKQTGAQNYDQLMKAAYHQAAKETGQQFKRIPNQVRTYGNDTAAERDYLARAAKEGQRPAEFMRRELQQGKPFDVYGGGETHPYMSGVDPASGLNETEMFRAVHDYFGHLGTKKPNTFGPRGEENAWLTHRQMYSPLAEPALTAETRGQNSWVNFVSPKNLELRRQGLPTEEYAANKPVLLPAEASDPAYTGGMPEYLKRIIK